MFNFNFTLFLNIIIIILNYKMEGNVESEIETIAREKAFNLKSNSDVIIFIDTALNMKC